MGTGNSSTKTSQSKHPCPSPTSSNSEVVASPKKKAKLTATDDNESQPSSDHEECLICCNEYAPFNHSPSLWKELKCSHRLCQACFRTIETTRTTMSGARHTFVKCPFCQGTSGIEIGDCPNGTMAVANVSASCSGFRVKTSIKVHYYVNTRHYHLNRAAYLPNNAEGKEVLKLLQTAWDRRLCFTIGTSVTTGAEDVLVWNIHHKTSPNGGVASYGYPDPGYFGRVKSELKAYGIE